MRKNTTKITPENTEIKNFEQGFGIYGGGLSGGIVINNVVVGSFISDGRNEGIDNIYILDTELKQQMEDYQKENEEDEFYQTVEGFLLKAVDIHLMLTEVKDTIKAFSKKYNDDKLTVAVFIFRDKNGYYLSTFNEVPVDPTKEELEHYKVLSRQHNYYGSEKEVYLVKYVSARKLLIEKLN